MSSRTSVIERKTEETDIRLELDIDGSGQSNIQTGIGFFDHMLTLFAKHAQFDITLVCKGDLEVDAHHSVEDCGIVMGRAFAQAVGEKTGIARYATCFMPMDETLVMAALDISGRPYCVFDVNIQKVALGNFDAELCEEFFRAFITNACVTLHIRLEYGSNTHHIVEAVFKAVAHALRQATRIDPNIEGVLSTKGTL